MRENRSLLLIFIGESTLFYRSRCSSITMHFYHGLPISLYYLAEEGKCIKETSDATNTNESAKRTQGSLKLKKVTLGPEGPENGQTFHATITKNTWFSRILEKEDSGLANGKHQNGMYIHVVY